ncbi:MAG TPA: adenylate/guanylate cyclase domain-containing protein [Candidatus Saccharimonadia bacterium]|nr:adenylate/guanylate cyclase domain-containing protein [Candidatus Saccharimonadia bacterium]
MHGRIAALRCLCAAAALLGSAASFAWILDSGLPDARAAAWAGFPLVEFQLYFVRRDKLPETFGLALYAIAAATVALASALSAWLAWRAVDRAPVRRLALALALGSLSVAYLWFFRELEPWRGTVATWTPVLDRVSVMAGVFGAVALVACFRIYPEPLTQEFSRRTLDSYARGQSDLSARMRAGEGIWRLWSWLPKERYGAFGRTQDPGRRGLSRFLRSRELCWIVLVVALALGIDSWAPFLSRTSGLWRVGEAVMWAMMLAFFIDPVAQARAYELHPFSLNRASVRMRLASFEVALHRAVESVPGLLALALFGLFLHWLWQRPPIAGTVVLLVTLFLLVLFNHALSLLFLNWQHGTAEHRRAIGWVVFGTLGASALWVVVMLLALLWATRTVFGASSDGATMFATGTILIGPPAIALALVASLWASVLYRGGLDPALALRRGASIALLGLLLTTLFVGVEGAISAQIATRVGLPSQTGAVIAGTLVALAFGPVRLRVERRIGQVVRRLLPPEALAAGERRDCVVAFADLSGYTRLAQESEAEALTLAAILQRAAHALAPAHGGRVVKTIGDAVLMVFETPHGAIDALRALHARYGREVESRALEHLPVHTGMHRGEVVVASDGDVYGASVNLAARLQALAGADELVASASCAEALAQAGFTLEILPARRFKNIPQPVDCVRARAVGAT